MNDKTTDKEKEELQVIKEILTSTDSTENLITILLEIQNSVGYLPREGMQEVAHHLNITETAVYSVATFYNRFRFVPPGRYQIRACMGTACHVKRGGVILDSWKRKLEINEGEVTEDREYSIDRVDCVGCCAMAPVTVINDDVLGHMSPSKVDGILLQHQIKRDKKKKE